MKTIKDKVMVLLEDYPYLRDNDFKLIANFYALEIGSENLDKMTARDFLKMFSDGRLPHSESIRRDRQKLQEQNISLRGMRYKQRKNDGDDTSKEIRSL